jgi:hypothetical protein
MSVSLALSQRSASRCVAKAPPPAAASRRIQVGRLVATRRQLADVAEAPTTRSHAARNEVHPLPARRAEREAVAVEFLRVGVQHAIELEDGDRVLKLEAAGQNLQAVHCPAEPEFGLRVGSRYGGTLLAERRASKASRSERARGGGARRGATSGRRGTDQSMSL